MVSEASICTMPSRPRSSLDRRCEETSLLCLSHLQILFWMDIYLDIYKAVRSSASVSVSVCDNKLFGPDRIGAECALGKTLRVLRRSDLNRTSCDKSSICDEKAVSLTASICENFRTFPPVNMIPWYPKQKERFCSFYTVILLPSIGALRALPAKCKAVIVVLDWF